MRLFTGLLIVVVASGIVDGAEPELLPEKQLRDGAIQLFDGETLFGWQPTGEAEWEVVDGELRTSGEKPGFLMTTTRWADFIMEVQYRAPVSTNSGIFLRTSLEPKDPGKDCYELNIAPPDNPFPTGSFVARQQGQATGEHVPKSDEWHTFGIAARGGKFMISLDDRHTLLYSDRTPIRIGHIGLQSNSGPIAFRRIRLWPLGVKTLFNGRNLNGWSTERAEKSRFEVTDDGLLRVLDGPGQIETAGDYANFVLQLECKTNGEGLNSGIFLRALRNGRWAGYESQIHNGFVDGDRTKPRDFGTGGIYRRQPARRVVADDRAWFAKTIVVDGPHMAVWVNGYQVSDWTDDRPPHENAREGFRAGAGAITIQGHDPTTDLLFRNLRLVELPE